MDKPTTAIAFGLRIKAGRTRLGLSLEDFAERLGVSRGTQSNYEAGVTMPSLEYAEKCAELGIRISEKLVPSGNTPSSNNLEEDDISVQLIGIILNHWDPRFNKKRITSLFAELLELYRVHKH